MSTKYACLLIIRMFEMIRTQEREEGNIMAKAALKKKATAKKKPAKKVASKKRATKRRR
jgi:hypothetical protein